MSYFHFFTNDGACRYMIKEIIGNFPKYLYEPVEYEGKMVKFYVILNWVKTKTRGANIEWMDEIGINYVNTIEDLPEGAGIYTTGYDADIKELEAAEKAGIPVINNSCPWILTLKKQIRTADSGKYQTILVIDADHMIHQCYRHIFPDDIIIVQAETFREQLKAKNITRPVYLMIYAVHRKKDAENIISFIEQKFPHPDNSLDNYKKTLCCWSNQGLLEEISQAVSDHKLEEIWVVCSSANDRSTRSITNQIIDTGARPVIIKKKEDIPVNPGIKARVGVLLAPIPLSKEKRSLINLIRRQYGDAREIVKMVYDAFVPLLLEKKDRNRINRKIDEILDLFAEDISWYMAGVEGITPIAGLFEGKSEVRKFFTVYKKEILQQDIDIKFLVGEKSRIDAHVFEESIAVRTGKKFQIDVIHSWEINNKGRIRSFKSYNDTYMVQRAFTKD